MYFMKRSFVIPQFTTHVYQAKQKKIPHQSYVSKTEENIA